MCGSKKSRFIKEQRASGSLLGPNSTLNKIPILGGIFQRYKINEILNKFLLIGDKFIPETHLRQPRYTCSACGPFTKN